MIPVMVCSNVIIILLAILGLVTQKSFIKSIGELRKREGARIRSTKENEDICLLLTL